VTFLAPMSFLTNISFLLQMFQDSYILELLVLDAGRGSSFWCEIMTLFVLLYYYYFENLPAVNQLMWVDVTQLARLPEIDSHLLSINFRVDASPPSRAFSYYSINFFPADNRSTCWYILCSTEASCAKAPSHLKFGLYQI
jgi:hypothetical protein